MAAVEYTGYAAVSLRMRSVGRSSGQEDTTLNPSANSVVSVDCQQLTHTATANIGLLLDILVEAPRCV